MDQLSHLAQLFQPPSSQSSLFISFEGIEGSGKSTQVQLLKGYLENKGYHVLTIREPGGTAFGEQLRKAVLNSQKELHPIAEMHLFASSRAQLLKEITIPHLKKNRSVVIYDRYIDSSLGYQGGGRKLGLKTILQCHQDFPLTLVPHFTFYLEISLKQSMERQIQRQLPFDYFESRGEDFFSRVIDGYEEAIKLFPNRIKRIDGQKSQHGICDEIMTHLNDVMEK